MKQSVLSVLAIGCAIAASTSVQAADRIVVEDGPEVVVERGPDAVVTSRTRVYRSVPRAYEEGYAPVEAYEPPVYGWVRIRPLNCGTYHYWDGVACVDARDRDDRD
jgi:hypothetical protein